MSNIASSVKEEADARSIASDDEDEETSPSHIDDKITELDKFGDKGYGGSDSQDG